ncbi:dephospho-CoA kinase [Intestinimonas massiliensis (ex Afouda et al. 2020)]|uniref:dephospho-CoA kinase n=1 Tax=Intestinimonas massiliensis (ex Afouda et al. 2020) TaxID=1673721 RepID=UPI001031D2FB|nr:dephospho-CoA kinase [Intestinimonas massiliensis (ex Afouda et al. 2020)]
MKRIGITGPTGAGKTTALNALTSLGAHVIDADAVYHDLLESSAPMKEALTERFGTGILDDQGKIDRKALGNVVFADPQALSDLNAITHRFVLAEIDRQAARAEAEGRPAVAIDAIALIESGAAEGCDAVVGVLAPKEVRVRRIMAREGISEEYARKRVEAQQGDEFFRSRCTHILENGGQDPKAFEDQALALFGPWLDHEENQI